MNRSLLGAVTTNHSEKAVIDTIKQAIIKTIEQACGQQSLGIRNGFL
jgi:hypothetical protein